MQARRVTGGVLANATGLAVFAVMIFPIYWMIATAFKTGREILSLQPKFLPTVITLDNFADAVARPHFLENVRNSLLIVAGVVLVSLAFAFFAGVAVARFQFKGRAPFIIAMLAVQMVPLNALIIPVYLMLDGIGLTDTLPGVVITYMAFVLPFMVWTLRGFVTNVPIELEEAAQIDGCSRIGAFRRILLPLVAPGLVATAIFGFIQAWNEYIVAYVLLRSPEKQTLTVWLASFTTNHGTDWGPLMAGATLTAIPVVIFFLLVQRHVASGLVAGSVKG
jgi:N,N'-diacetylchitobiose transport system permease protein